MSSKWDIVVCCFLISVAFAKNLRQDSIGFVEPEEDIKLVNKDNRQPVYIPALCPLNELLYPGDQKDDWICDCRPAHLYHPKTDTCWPAYRKGPCEIGNYLTLTSESAIPICQKNPCNTDNYVMYNGRCERLGAIEPCRNMWPIAAAVAVNASTLTVTCERINLESRFGEETLTRLNTDCQLGGKRNINGKCATIKP